MFQNVFCCAIRSDDSDNGKHNADNGRGCKGKFRYDSEGCHQRGTERSYCRKDGVYGENTDDCAEQAVLFEDPTAERNGELEQKTLEYGSHDQGNDPKPDLRTAVDGFHGFPYRFKDQRNFWEDFFENLGISDGSAAENNEKTDERCDP